MAETNVVMPPVPIARDRRRARPGRSPRAPLSRRVRRPEELQDSARAAAHRARRADVPLQLRAHRAAGRTRSSSPSAIPRASWSSTRSPACSATRIIARVATLSQITDLLKKTEQSQRVLDEASEGLTFDVLTGDENSDENISIEKLTSERKTSAPSSASSTPPSSPRSSAAPPTFTSRATTIRFTSSTASTACCRKPWRPSPASTTAPSSAASRS